MASEPFACKYCGDDIYVDDSVTSPSGKRIPLNAGDSSYHNCAEKASQSVASVSQESKVLLGMIETLKRKVEEQSDRITKLEGLLGKESPQHRIAELERKVFELQAQLKLNSVLTK